MTDQEKIDLLGEALTDANFHTLRETLEKEIKKEFERIDKAVL